MFKMFYNEEKSDKVIFRRRKDNIYMIWNYLFNLEKLTVIGTVKILIPKL